MCQRYEYDCYYGKKRKHERSATDAVIHHYTRSSASHSTPGNDEQLRNTSVALQGGPKQVSKTLQNRSGDSTSPSSMRYTEANSGFAFPQVLETEFGPSQTQYRYNYAWNLGLRSEPTPTHTTAGQIIPQDVMERLASVYFDKLQPLYAFLDRQHFDKKLNELYNPAIIPDPYHAVLFGVAACGSLFSGTNSDAREEALVLCAKNVLENATCAYRDLSLHHVEGWLLRVLYLRMAVGPHASWLASCTTMHIIEGTNTHRDTSSTSIIHPRTITSEAGLTECRARLFWTARLLNTWISYEYGRSRVELRGVSIPKPTPSDSAQETHFHSLLALWQFSERFNSPDDSPSPAELTSMLSELSTFPFSHPALILHKANNAFAIFRRLRISAQRLSPSTVSTIISLGKAGTQAALEMAAEQQPWWHVANVPFQFICVLLVLDTQASLSAVSGAMNALERIAGLFETFKMRKAVQMARSLRDLCRKRKREALRWLDSDDEDLAGEDAEEVVRQEQQTDVVKEFDFVQDLPTVPMDGAEIDLENFDWDYFLNSDF